MRIVVLAILMLFLGGCSSMDYNKTVPNLEVNKFMGKWYVNAGRFTFLETGAHNAVETYTWNESKKRIDVEFSFNKNSLNGELKSYSQKAWIHNKKTNAHWKISPFWPLKLNYLVIGLAADYSWTAVGVPDGKYLWIMSKDPKLGKETVDQILTELKASGYPVNDIVFVPHN